MFGLSEGGQVAAITTSGLVVVAFFGYLGARLTNKSVKAVKQDLADVHDTVRDVKKDTHTIDQAVNNAEVGMPTIAQRVIDQDKRSLNEADNLAEFRAWQAEVLRLVVDKLHIDAPAAPAVVPTVPVAIPSGPDEITMPRLTNGNAGADEDPSE